MYACDEHAGTENAWILGQQQEMTSSFPTQGIS